MRYRVLRDGAVSQRPGPGLPIKWCPAGAVIEVGDEMARQLLEAGHLEALDGLPPFDETPGSIATVNSDEAVALVAAADEAAELDRLEKAEKSSRRHPGGRKGVLKAIAERREELA